MASAPPTSTVQRTTLLLDGLKFRLQNHFAEDKILNFYHFLLPILEQCFDQKGNTLDFEYRFSRDTPRNREYTKSDLTIVSGWIWSSSSSQHMMVQIISPLPSTQKVIDKGSVKVIKASETFFFQRKDHQYLLTKVVASVLGVIARRNNPKTEEEELKKGDISFILSKAMTHKKLEKALPANHIICAPIYYKPFLTPSGKLKLEFEQPRCIANFEYALHYMKIPTSFENKTFKALGIQDIILYLISLSDTLLLFDAIKFTNMDVKKDNLCIALPTDAHLLMIDLDHVVESLSAYKQSKPVKHWDSICNEFGVATPFLHVVSMAYIIGNFLDEDFYQSLTDGDLMANDMMFEATLIMTFRSEFQKISFLVDDSPNLKEFDAQLENLYDQHKNRYDIKNLIICQRAKIRLAWLILDIYHNDDARIEELDKFAPRGVEGDPHRLDEGDRSALCRYFYLQNKHKFISMLQCKTRLQEIYNFIKNL